MAIFNSYVGIPVGLLGRHHLHALHELLDLGADDPTAKDREEIR